METLTLVRIGRSARLERLLPAALAEFPVTELPAEQIASAAGRRLLFAVAVDAYGPDEAFVRLLRTLRQNPDCLCGQIIFQKDGYNMARRSPVAQALPKQLALLQQYGYRVVTVSELLSLCPFADLSLRPRRRCWRQAGASATATIPSARSKF